MKTLLRKAILAIFLLLFCTTFVKAEVFYVDTDAYGTPVAVSKSDGTTVWESDYYPFGELYSNINNQKPNNRGLIGKEKDQETGLTYFGARYYDEALARFGSVDPIGPVDPWTSQTDYAYLTNPQRLNRYVYGMNNPYRYVDPDGRFSQLAEAPFEAASIAMGIDSGFRNYMDGKYLDAAIDAVGVSIDISLAAFPGMVGAGFGIQAYRASKIGLKNADDVIHVTPDGVALPKGPKYEIPDNYVENPYGRSGNYGEMVDGKFQEKLRIDPATPPGKKGPNYSHYHKDGKRPHYSPKPSDKDPGF